MNRGFVMKSSTARRFVGSALLLSAIVPLSPVWGADQAPRQGAGAPQSHVSDADLKAFAKAYVQYQHLRESYETKITNVRDEKEKDRLQREGNEKVKQALEKHGLTPQAYNKLFAAVNGNQQLREKALGLINDERKKS
jgi:hypothetical protein